MKLFKPGKDSVSEILTTLNNGGVFIYPTETCYGIGVDATNPQAVAKVFEIKGRDENKPISIAVASAEIAHKYVEVNPYAEELFQRYTPGPITIICKSKGLIDKKIESAQGTLGVRVPGYSMLLEILEKIEKPVTSTSANKSGDANPYTIEEVITSLGDKASLIDVVIDAGELDRNNLPSTVIDTTVTPLVIVRQGSLGIEISQL